MLILKYVRIQNFILPSFFMKTHLVKKAGPINGHTLTTLPIVNVPVVILQSQNTDLKMERLLQLGAGGLPGMGQVSLSLYCIYLLPCILLCRYVIT